jgi:hypothetical protein
MQVSKRLFRSIIELRILLEIHMTIVGDKVMLQKGSDNKYKQPYSGPHTILHVVKNGTVHLQVRCSH